MVPDKAEVVPVTARSCAVRAEFTLISAVRRNPMDKRQLAGHHHHHGREHHREQPPRSGKRDGEARLASTDAQQRPIKIHATNNGTLNNSP